MTSSKVIITFKDATPKETIDKAIADLENNGGKVSWKEKLLKHALKDFQSFLKEILKQREFMPCISATI